MEVFWILILVAIFATNSVDKAESVKLKLEELEELPLQTFEEIFGEGWWDKGEAEDLKTPAPTNFGQNVHHQIDRQNNQIGQIESNSTDQNPTLKESDHSDNDKNREDPNEISSNENIAENEQKRNIIAKFHAMKEEFKQKGKHSKKVWVQIEKKIAKHLKFNGTKIYKWKKEFGLNRRIPEKEERKNLVEKFDQMKAELTRAGVKNFYNHEIDETVAKELGITDRTIYKWKRQLGQTKPNKYTHSEQKELMKRYYEIKANNSKISEEKIAKNLKIGRDTLRRWKRQFKRQHLHPNSVDGQSVEENAAENVQEIENTNSGSI